MRLALFEPDIPQNAGAMLRLGACLGVPVDIVEPCGFPLGDADLRRVAMDYLEQADIARHRSWESFLAGRGGRGGRGGRLVLLTTRVALCYTDFAFRAEDTILVGRESAGVPEPVHAAADARLRVPMARGMRSLNVAISAAMVLGEALRQTAGFAAGGEEEWR